LCVVGRSRASGGRNVFPACPKSSDGGASIFEAPAISSDVRHCSRPAPFRQPYRYPGHNLRQSRVYFMCSTSEQVIHGTGSNSRETRGARGLRHFTPTTIARPDAVVRCLCSPYHRRIIASEPFKFLPKMGVQLRTVACSLTTVQVALT